MDAKYRVVLSLDSKPGIHGKQNAEYSAILYSLYMLIEIICGPGTAGQHFGASGKKP